MPDLCAPGPRLVRPPLTDAEDDGPPGGEERVPHSEVGLPGLELTGVAPVVLEVVDAPLGVGQGILILVTPASRAAGTGLPTRIRVDAELQPQRVHVVGQGLHPGGKALGVRLDEAPCITLAVPAIVDVDELVAGVFHPRGDHGIGGLTDELLVDVAGEGVPTVPPHRRRLGQILELLSGGRSRHQQRDDQHDPFHVNPPSWISINRESIPTFRMFCR